MRVALIGDVHANLPALEAVLADVRRRKVRQIWNVGDFVGYGPLPDEVVGVLREAGARSVVGNYDLKVLDEAGRKTGKNPLKDMAFGWAFEHLSGENRNYLGQLPRELRLRVGGRRVLLTHGSPASIDEHLMPETPAARLAELAAGAEADVIVVGHSHRPFARKVGGVWWINTGSVGRSDDGDPRACYAILTIGKGVFGVRHYRVEYDLVRTVEAIRERGLPEEFAQMVLQGRSLESVAGDKGGASPDGCAGADAKGGQLAALPPLVEQKEREAAQLLGVEKLLENCGADLPHACHVTVLALKLWDQLEPLHKLGRASRFLLQCAGLLHDIGWVEGGKGHHKASLRIIAQSPLLEFDSRRRQIIGCVGRYHRKATPSLEHEAFASLWSDDRRLVCMLSAILRVADGLDQSHLRLVSEVKCKVTAREITLHCYTSGPANREHCDTMEKGVLMQEVFGRKLAIQWHLA